jgi:hypothetical protein
MSKFDYPSLYYADDKDVSDLLSAPKFTVKILRRIVRERGIYLSPDLPKETIVEYIAQLPFSWPELVALIRTIETEEKEENATPIKIETTATLDQFHDAAKKVQELRGQLNSEVYTINVGEDSATILIKYREIDPRSTRTLQWIEHRMEIHAQRTEAGYQLTYADNKRAQDIVESLVEELPKPESGKLRLEAILLDGVNDPQKRTEFFRSIIYGMDGLRPENVKDLKMNRVKIDSEGKQTVESEELLLEGAEDEEEAAKTPQEAPASICKRTTLSGDSLLQTPEFHANCQKGFFIARAVWTAVERDGKGRKFEFEAESKKTGHNERFSYRLRGLWDRDEDGELGLRKETVGIADRRLLADKLEKAAFTALEKLTAPAEGETVPDVASAAEVGPSGEAPLAAPPGSNP